MSLMRPKTEQMFQQPAKTTDVKFPKLLENLAKINFVSQNSGKNPPAEI